MKKVCKVCQQEIDFGSNVNATTCPSCLEAGYKYCSQCNTVLPLSEFKVVGKNATGAKRYSGECKACAKHRSGEYYTKNKERIKERTEAYRKLHPANYTEYSKAFNERVPEHRAKQLHAANARYRKTLNCAMAIKRRNEKYNRSAKLGDLTAQQWQAILDMFEYRCAYCDMQGKLTMDHIVPVSKGGQLTKSNILPACQHCNSSRGNKSIDEWLAKLADTNRAKVLWYINEGHKSIE